MKCPIILHNLPWITKIKTRDPIPSKLAVPPTVYKKYIRMTEVTGALSMGIIMRHTSSNRATSLDTRLMICPEEVAPRADWLRRRHYTQQSLTSDKHTSLKKIWSGLTPLKQQGLNTQTSQVLNQEVFLTTQINFS